jgi:hypothetical protein
VGAGLSSSALRSIRLFRFLKGLNIPVELDDFMALL